MQDIPKCRRWAQQIGQNGHYQAPAPPLWTRRLDSIFLHPVAGPLIFIAVVVGVFQTIFSGAKPIMDALTQAIQSSGVWLGHLLPDSIFKSLLTEGVWSGVGSVIVFLPQILLLFLFIGVLEDSGYLARAALIADRTMAKFGLQGKSFIPLLSAYACAVPAIMATRTIENKRDRMATIMIAPLMTCSARLPVYTLLIAAFIHERPLIGHFLGTQAAVLLGLYVLGFVAAIFTAKMLKSSVLKKRAHVFRFGNAALPLAHCALHRHAPVRPLQDFFAARRHGDSNRLGRAMDPGASSLARWQAARYHEQLRRHDRPRRGAGYSAARL